jgi:uncharacterized OsmC-like protein
VRRYPGTVAEDDGAARVSLELEGNYRFRADFGGYLDPLVLDEPEPLGGGSGPNATAALAAAVGDCLSASLLYCLRRAHLEVEDMHTEVEVTPVRNAEGRLRIGSLDVVLRPAVDAGSEGRFGRCVELFEDYCVVTDSVRRGIEVSVRVEPSTTQSPLEGPSGDG